jgi:uncharacterized 2Fe-2S/4Fe-4S cluster protein (DUF4445 family)
MPEVKVISDGKQSVISFDAPIKLSNLLLENGFYVEHPCAGKGSCKKCTVKVDGREVLSCQYELTDSVTVVLPDRSEMLSVSGASVGGEVTENIALCLDIGTTTLALALVSLDTKQIIKVITKTNPQRAYGADVISRVDHCAKNGVDTLQKAVTEQIRIMIDEILDATNVSFVDVMYVAGNTTMLHLFLGGEGRSYSHRDIKDLVKGAHEALKGSKSQKGR